MTNAKLDARMAAGARIAARRGRVAALDGAPWNRYSATAAAWQAGVGRAYRMRYRAGRAS
jgi:hypothetical protein